jgi:hypothetical protein
MRDHSNPLDELLQDPLMHAIFGRRSRRSGLGMEIPSGPLALKSRSAPHPLTELEQAVLVAAGTGVAGWDFGIPFGPQRPDEHGHFTERFTGRTAPTAADIGTPIRFFSDDEGTYVTNPCDARPARIHELDDAEADAERILDVCRRHTARLSETRLEIPPEPGRVFCGRQQRQRIPVSEWST